MSQELSRWRKGLKMSPRYMSSFFREEMDRMGRLFDDFLRRESTTGLPKMWGPPLDIIETEGKIKVKAELPGIDPGSLDIFVSDECICMLYFHISSNELRSALFLKIVYEFYYLII